MDPVPRSEWCHQQGVSCSKVSGHVTEVSSQKETSGFNHCRESDSPLSPCVLGVAARTRDIVRWNGSSIDRMKYSPDKLVSV